MGGCSIGIADSEQLPTVYSPLLTKYMWLSGLSLLPTSPDVEKTSERRKSRRLTIWPILVATINSFLAIVMVMEYTSYYAAQLESLEFFSLVDILNDFNVAVQTPIIFYLMLSRGERIQHVIKKSSRLFYEICMSTNEVSKERRLGAKLVFGIILLFHAVLIISMVFGRMWEDLNNSESINEKGTFLVKLGLPAHTFPKYAYFVLMGITYVLELNSDLTAQLCYLWLIVVLTKSFGQVRHSIRLVRTHARDVGEQMALLRCADWYIQKLRNLTCELNDAFGYLILLNCVRDLVASVDLVASALRPTERLNFENLDEVRKRIHEDANRSKLDFTATTMDVVMGVVRLTCCLVCLRRVGQMRSELQMVESESMYPEVQIECVRSLGRIDQETGVISAGGFFHLSKEYVISVVGVMITYIILIYQTRGEKVHGYGYARESHLLNATQEILHAISELKRT